MEKEKKRMFLILIFILILFTILSLVFLIPLLNNESKQKTEETPIIQSNPGWLAVEKADVRGQEIVSAESGQQVGLLSPSQSKTELPEGLYHVSFGGLIWKNVHVKAGETTLLQPGILSINHASYRGHPVLDIETGKEIGLITNLAASMTLIPGSYRVMFGGAHWDLDIMMGQKLILNPGVVNVEGASYRGHAIHLSDGTEVGSVSNTGSSMPLPPGEYTIFVNGETTPFTLEEGQQLTFTEK